MGNVQLKKYNNKYLFFAYKDFSITNFINKYNSSKVRLDNIKLFIYYEKVYSGRFTPIVLKIFKKIMPNLEKIVIKNDYSIYKSKNDIIFNIKNI